MAVHRRLHFDRYLYQRPVLYGLYVEMDGNRDVAPNHGDRGAYSEDGEMTSDGREGGVDATY